MQQSEDHMRQAIEWGEKARHLTAPQPWVGCVLVSASGMVVAQAHSGGGGGRGRRAAITNHHHTAEEAALLLLAPGAGVGGTCYVTLEPLAAAAEATLQQHAHTDARRVGQALLAGGITQAVVGLVRPQSHHRWLGVHEWKRCGLSVTVLNTEHPQSRAIQASLRSFIHHAGTGRPYCVAHLTTNLTGEQCIVGAATAAGVATPPPHTLEQTVAAQQKNTQALLLGSRTALEDHDYALAEDTWIVVVASSRYCATQPLKIWERSKHCVLVVAKGPTIHAADDDDVFSEEEEDEVVVSATAAVVGGDEVVVEKEERTTMGGQQRRKNDELYDDQQHHHQKPRRHIVGELHPNVRVVTTLGSDAPRGNRLHPATLLEYLGDEGILDCCILGGRSLYTAFLSCGFIDELVTYYLSSGGGGSGSRRSTTTWSGSSIPLVANTTTSTTTTTQRTHHHHNSTTLDYHLSAVHRMSDEIVCLRHEKPRPSTELQAALQQLRAGEIICVADDRGGGGVGIVEEQLKNVTLLTLARTLQADTFLRLQDQASLYKVHVALSEARARTLKMPSMVDTNEEVRGTNYLCHCDVVVVVAAEVDSSTDNAVATIRALADPHRRPADFTRPGCTSLIAAGALSERVEPAEVSVALCELAGIYPPVALMGALSSKGMGGVVDEENTTTAAAAAQGRRHTKTSLQRVCHKRQIPLVWLSTVLALVPPPSSSWGVEEEPNHAPVATCQVSLHGVAWTLHTFVAHNGPQPHQVLTLGRFTLPDTLCRVQSGSFVSDVLQASPPLCEGQQRWQHAAKAMVAAGRGVLVYVSNQEGRGSGTVAQQQALNFMQEHPGCDSFEAYRVLGWPEDVRDFSQVRLLLRYLHLRNYRLLTRNPRKKEQLRPHKVCDDLADLSSSADRSLLLARQHAWSKNRLFSALATRPYRVSVVCTRWSQDSVEEEKSAAAASGGSKVPLVVTQCAELVSWLRSRGCLVAVHTTTESPMRLFFGGVGGGGGGGLEELVGGHPPPLPSSSSSDGSRPEALVLFGHLGRMLAADWSFLQQEVFRQQRALPTIINAWQLEVVVGDGGTYRKAIKVSPAEVWQQIQDTRRPKVWED